MTLPQIVFHDPDWFFYMAAELRAFKSYPSLCNQAAIIEDRACRIAVPGREPGDYKLWYWFDPIDGHFSRIEVVDADRVYHGSSLVLVSDWIDLSLLRTMKRYDKAGGKRLVRQITYLLLGDAQAELTKAFCEAFFDNPANFG